MTDQVNKEDPTYAVAEWMLAHKKGQPTVILTEVSYKDKAEGTYGMLSMELKVVPVARSLQAALTPYKEKLDEVLRDKQRLVLACDALSKSLRVMDGITDALARDDSSEAMKLASEYKDSVLALTSELKLLSKRRK